MADNPTIVLIPHTRSHPFSQRECSCLEPLKVGRSVDKKRIFSNNLIFDCRVLSRNHALIWYENGKFFIQDTKSSNGTFVNESRLSPSGEESAPVELRSRDTVQFGVNVNVEKRVTHGCIIATIMLYINEVELPSPDPDVHQIMQIVQSSLSREQELETKLALMQEALNAARALTNESMISIVKEDELISRMEMLENQLQVYSQNSQEDDLKKQLARAMEDKQKSETTAKESLRSLLREKLECESKILQLQRDYDKAELECQQYKTLYEVMKQENTHELAKTREQLKNTERDKKTLEDKLSEEKSTLTAATETLKADVDFTKQQLNSVRARLEQTQDELFRYKVIVETEKQRKALALGAASPALNGHHSPAPEGVGHVEGEEGAEQPPQERKEDIPPGSHDSELGTQRLDTVDSSIVQQPEESLVLGTLVTIGATSDTLSRLAASEALVEELRSSVHQYQLEIQSLNAELTEGRAKENQLQLSLSVLGGQLNTCFDQIQTQSTEIVRLRECASASVDRTGHQSQPVNEDAHLSELNFLKSKFIEKERELEEQLMRCKEELRRVQEECGRLQQEVLSVQVGCSTQLRVSQDEAVSLKKHLLEAQEESKTNLKKSVDLNEQLVVARNFRPYMHPGQDDQHARLINTVALVAVGVALAAMVLSVFS